MSDFDHSMRMLERGDTLPAAVAQSAMALIMRGGVSTESLTVWLRLLSTRTPTADELLGCTEAFMAHAVRVPTRTAPDRIVDTCGTGGAPKVFNASTLSALLVAAAGAPVAKHGNRSRTGFGSAETLEALGVDLNASPQAGPHHTVAASSRGRRLTARAISMSPTFPSAAFSASRRTANGISSLNTTANPMV